MARALAWRVSLRSSCGPVPRMGFRWLPLCFRAQPQPGSTLPSVEIADVYWFRAAGRSEGLGEDAEGEGELSGSHGCVDLAQGKFNSAETSGVMNGERL